MTRKRRPQCSNTISGQRIVASGMSMRSPRSHPFIERLIGTIRRELIDPTLFWNAVELVRKLETSKDYYNRSRTHASPGGNTPEVSVSRRLPVCKVMPRQSSLVACSNSQLRPNSRS
jgi:hypothetical protein